MGSVSWRVLLCPVHAAVRAELRLTFEARTRTCIAPSGILWIKEVSCQHTSQVSIAVGSLRHV
jgi:hypothetical protein